MNSHKILIVRLESGENIAQYTSQTAQPLVGDIINIRHLGHVQPFEIVKATFQPIIENYEIAVLIVKPSVTTTILGTVIYSSQVRDLLVGLLIGFIYIIFHYLKKRLHLEGR